MSAVDHHADLLGKGRGVAALAKVEPALFAIAVGAIVVRGMICQVDGIRTIRINDENFVVARKFFAKYDAGTIWRPVRAGTDLCSWNFCQR